MAKFQLAVQHRISAISLILLFSTRPRPWQRREKKLHAPIPINMTQNQHMSPSYFLTGRASGTLSSATFIKLPSRLPNNTYAPFLEHHTCLVQRKWAIAPPSKSEKGIKFPDVFTESCYTNVRQIPSL